MHGGRSHSSIYIECQSRYDSAVQLILSKGTVINLSTEDRAIVFLKVCQNGRIANILLFIVFMYVSKLLMFECFC